MISRLKFFPRKPYSNIDEKIKILVNAMNATEFITTIASCQGHGFPGKPPYVYFKSSANTAASIERLLREASMLDDARFKEVWVVEGQFDQDFKLTFLLYSPAYHEMSYSFMAFIFFGVFRKRLDSELLSLAGIIEQAMLLKIRDEYEPHIAARNNDHCESN